MVPKPEGQQSCAGKRLVPEGNSYNMQRGMGGGGGVRTALSGHNIIWVATSGVTLSRGVGSKSQHAHSTIPATSL